MTDLMGPVEIAVIEFPGNGVDGNPFNGNVVPALVELVNAGIVAILDLVIVTKSAEGSVAGIEISDLDPVDAAAFDDLDGTVNGLLSAEDLDLAAQALAPGATAALIVWEATWARRLANAVAGSGGRLVAHDRIDAATVRAALDAS